MTDLYRCRIPGIFLALITSVVGMALPASAAEGPRMVVSIMIDGLDDQYVELLRSKFGPDGFNRLLRDGVIIANADYGTNVDPTAAAAMVMTGASPNITGVSGAEVYDRPTGRIRSVMFDADAMGNFTSQTFSPKALSVSTLSDEVRIAGGGVNRVFSIAADPSMAIVTAGHSAGAALWINDETGNWATSTYYKDLPSSVTYRNRLRPLAARLDTLQWTPVAPESSYPGLPEHLTHYKFRYTFPRANSDRYAMFAASPMVNTEVTDLATELIDDLKLGTAEAGAPDMINVTYSLRPYDYTRNSDNRYELMDSYLRLDRDLSRLMTKADNAAGKDGAVYIVAALPPSGRTRRDDERWNIPFGEFSTKRAKSLLNMYLMAKFGNGEWVTSFYEGQFFLNHKLVESAGVSAHDIRREAADFLERMTGVSRVITIDEILSGRGDSRLEAMQRNVNPAGSGDLFVEVAPGWETVDDIVTPADPSRPVYVSRMTPPLAPVFILAPDLDARTIDTPVDIRVIAPTVARILRIRSPNAAAMPPLSLK
ncbi:MAG: alkaline phosphatase family protein [Muribaculaceae bacterium]|nr:alkaline phosphatase family protein [Muribaculaceae bacterium]